MAEKKKEAETPVAEPISNEVIEAIKAELRESIKEELKAEMETEAKPKETAKKVTGETEAQKAYANEKVPYILPIIDGEPEEVNVTVNGETIQILRGEQVQIKRKFAEVLDNREEQARFCRKFQKEKREQIIYEEK